MNNLERIARDIVFGGNLSNADAVLLWEHLTGFRPRQAKRCERCGAVGSSLEWLWHGMYQVDEPCVACRGTGYVDGFTPVDAEGQVAAMVEEVEFSPDVDSLPELTTLEKQNLDETQICWEVAFQSGVGEAWRVEQVVRREKFSARMVHWFSSEQRVANHIAGAKANGDEIVSVLRFEVKGGGK